MLSSSASPSSARGLMSGAKWRDKFSDMHADEQLEEDRTILTVLEQTLEQNDTPERDVSTQP